MNQHAIEGRIQTLQQQMDTLVQQRKALDEQIARAQGRLDEMWDWHRAREKGHIQMPVFGDSDKMEAAIANRGLEVVPGIDYEEAKTARTNVAIRAGQSAIDEMDGMPDGNA
jgi:hypothetical protein